MDRQAWIHFTVKIIQPDRQTCVYLWAWIMKTSWTLRGCPTETGRKKREKCQRVSSTYLLHWVRKKQMYAMSCDQAKVTKHLTPPGFSMKFLYEKEIFTWSAKSFEDYISTLPVFDFNSSRYDLNLIKSHHIPIPTNEKYLEPLLKKRPVNSFLWSLGTLKCWLYTTSFVARQLPIFFEGIRNIRVKKVFSLWMVWLSIKTWSQKTTIIKCFSNKLRNYNPLEIDYNQIEKLLFSGYTKHDSLTEMKVQMLLSQEKKKRRLWIFENDLEFEKPEYNQK